MNKAKQNQIETGSILAYVVNNMTVNDLVNS